MNCTFDNTICGYSVRNTSTSFAFSYVFSISSLGEMSQVIINGHRGYDLCLWLNFLCFALLYVEVRLFIAQNSDDDDDVMTRMTSSVMMPVCRRSNSCPGSSWSTIVRSSVNAETVHFSDYRLKPIKTPHNVIFRRYFVYIVISIFFSYFIKLRSTNEIHTK